jgi:uncharacterized membrane protein
MEKILHALFFCHRLPERSFFYKGNPLPLCARCTGILIGYLIGMVYAFFIGNISLLIAFVLIIPLILDGGFQALGQWESTNMRRLITGLLAGVGVDFIIYGIIAFGYDHGRMIISLFR